MGSTQDSRIQQSNALAICFVVIAVEYSHLGWEAFHGGVHVHHLLAQRQMPGVSNLWGLLIAPALAGWANWRWRSRAGGFQSVLPRLLVGALTGIALSTAFSSGAASITNAIFFSILMSSLIFPVYATEFLLGFVMGMCWTFGAVIPLVAGCIIMAISAIAHLGVYRGARALWRRYRTKPS